MSYLQILIFNSNFFVFSLAVVIKRRAVSVASGFFITPIGKLDLRL